MDITYIINRPRFRFRNTANITAAGYLYFNNRLAQQLEINEDKRYKLGVIIKQGVEYPAIVEDSGGNKISKQHTGYVLYMKNLKKQFELSDNQKVRLEKFSVKKQRGFLLVTVNKEYNTAYN